MFRWTLKDIDTGQIQVLTKDPRGWEDLNLKHERDQKWHGLNYDFTNEFGFFCKGAGKELVDIAYENKGQEANVLLTLDVKCDGAFTRLFTGKLLFSKYRQEWEAGVLYSFLEVENDDIKKLLNNRKDMEVDLFSTNSLDGVSLPTYPYGNYTIDMHSKVIRLESSWENSGSLQACKTFESTALFELHVAEWLKEMGEIRNSNDIPAVIDVGSSSVPSINPLIEFDDLYEYPMTVTINYNLAGTFYDRAFDTIPGELCSGSAQNVSRGTLSTGVFLQLKIGQTFATATEWILLTIPQYNVISIYSDNFTTTGSQSITAPVNRGDKLWLMWVMGYSIDSAPHDVQFEWAYTVADISIISDTTTAASTANGIAIHEAWSRLSSIITDQPTAFYSEFFGRTDSNIVYPTDGCGSKTAITSGLNIRGFDASIATSLKDMFDACNSIWAIGIGIEDYNSSRVIRAEPVYYFYSDTVILTLENVPNIQMSHIESRVYNQVSLGFRKWQTESTNGLDEPLTKIEYVIPPIKNTNNKLSLISPFIAGMYAIEQTRRKDHLDYATEDTSYDEDIFFICLNNDDLTIPEKNENFQTITGLLSPETAYNLRFLLSSTFDRVKYQFTAGLTKLGTMADPVLMPAEGEGNEDVTYAFIPDGCDGDHFGSQQSNGRAGRYPHAQARRENPLWLPEEFTFEYPLSFTDYLTLIANPYGLVRFSDGQDNFYSGWLLSLEYNVRQKSGAFRIIRKYG